MGKRKLHDQTYYQCDWTGFPMKDSNCYMPTWPLDKLVKKGSYCNWESVLAHAKHIYEVDKQLEDNELHRIRVFVRVQMGDTNNITEAPSYTDLEHFTGKHTTNGFQHSTGGKLTAEQYHQACCYQIREVLGVKISETGKASEVLLTPENGEFDFTKYFTSPEKNTFTSLELPRKSKHKEKELRVFYHSDKHNLELNSFASNLFKTQIHGEVLLVQCTKEPSFMPRKRYINYSLNEYQDTFCRKRKRGHEDTTMMDAEQYKELKAQMQDSLCAYEKLASSQAQLPSAIGKSVKMPPPNGRQLAKLVKHERALVQEVAA
jgi:hypothetical protein